MKTKDLILALQKIDPTGELECCVDNIDIYTIRLEPSYWDGLQQVLIRDPNLAPYYNVVGAKYVSDNTKVRISCLSIEDAIFEDEKLVVTYDDHSKRMEEKVEQYREQSEKIKNNCECIMFVSYVHEKCPDLDETAAIKYYNNHLHYSDEMPEDIRTENKSSWFERRKKQWDRQINIDVLLKE